MQTSRGARMQDPECWIPGLRFRALGGFCLVRDPQSRIEEPAFKISGTGSWTQDPLDRGS